MKRRFGSNQAKPVTTFWSIRPKMKIKWKQLFFPHRSLKETREGGNLSFYVTVSFILVWCQTIPFVCISRSHCKLKTNVQENMANIRIVWATKAYFPLFSNLTQIPSKKNPARTQIYQEENIASFGKRTLFVRMASKRFATKQLYECSYLLGSIVYNLIFMSCLWYKNKSILQISGKKLSLTCIDVARIYIIAMFEHVTNTV